ncbi:hypothetical protein EV215_0457 [Hypnocyclicus thermotrophus]|uniref:Radical SAM core domain-containing protein n=1 Tax=Hypnocyclicus thermotrophus TaxID=1627895 RepID=A0AA46I5Z0_9FUSO|nr:TIGR01212 family radical SAM protein [Hypnocyclicus thermotrophus]TDT71773.1 hypothetical protein EV215_0457 [Hypnocyclicus thermotrophus]
MWGDKRYNNLNYELKKTFGKKIYKVSLNAGLSCPNRDGKISYGGCIFCSEEGSGEHAGNKLDTITEQINKQIKLIKNKHNSDSVIAYFQSFTNTYGNINYLRKIFYEAINHKNVIGLAIATRPDCINKEILDLLNELNKKTFLWIEIGLQTIHEKTAKLINRGYSLHSFENSFYKLKNNNIKTVIHIIAGLPYETKEEYFDSIEYINKIKPWGIKIHLLYIIKNSSLYYLYLKEKFHVFSEKEYINLIVNSIKILDKNIIIHRITGDGDKDTLFKPKWSLNKRRVLNEIQKKLKLENIIQGNL